MKTWLKAMLCISLSLMCIFACIGYAAISNQLVISGTATAEPREPEGLYISAVEVSASSNVAGESVEIVYPTSLRSSLRANARNASITYKITVHNKTDMTYWYLGIKHDGQGDNALVNATNGVSITTRDGVASNAAAFDSSDWIPPQTERTFYATYTYGSNAQGNRSLLVNFSFGLHVESVSDGFLKVLNDKTSSYGYHYLANAFDQSYAQDESKVLGNVGEDKEIFDNLFGSNITVNIDGQNVPVTIMVERTDVDEKSGTGDAYSGNGAPSGCEYTVYVTVDNSTAAGQTATVYAVTYTCGADGVWYMIGELYEGTCKTVDYDTSNQAYEPAFDVDSWRATQKEYTVINNVTYKVGYTNQGTEYDQYNTIELLMSKFDQEFYNKVNNNSASFLQTVCKTVYTYTNHYGQYKESDNLENIVKPGYADLKQAFDRIKPYCLIANGAQEVKLQNANSLSRAELIQMLEAIQMTYEYYLAVNSK